jgi:hypothetical protein
MNTQSQAFCPTNRNIFHVNPPSASGSERNRLGAKKEQTPSGPFRKQHIPPGDHSGKLTVWRRIVAATDQNGGGSLREATVYCMLDSVGGRP